MFFWKYSISINKFELVLREFWKDVPSSASCLWQFWHTFAGTIISHGKILVINILFNQSLQVLGVDLWQSSGSGRCIIDNTCLCSLKCMVRFGWINLNGSIWVGRTWTARLSARATGSERADSSLTKRAFLAASTSWSLNIIFTHYSLENALTRNREPISWVRLGKHKRQLEVCCYEEHRRDQNRHRRKHHKSQT